MYINLEVYYELEGNNRNYQRGAFFVAEEEFKNPDFVASVDAYKWTQEIYKEHGCRDMKITKVLYNEVNNITEIVKQIRPVIKDDLPFWKICKEMLKTYFI